MIKFVINVFAKFRHSLKIISTKDIVTPRGKGMCSLEDYMTWEKVEVTVSVVMKVALIISYF